MSRNKAHINHLNISHSKQLPFVGPPQQATKDISTQNFTMGISDSKKNGNWR